MSVTMKLGKSGRLVVPKAIRDTLGLHEGSRLKLNIKGEKIEVEPESDPISITLIGGRLAFLIPAAMAADMLREQLMPRIEPISLDADDLRSAYGDCGSRGIRGGAICDYLLLVAPRKAGAKTLHTLNEFDFLSLYRPGDPKISVPNI